MLPALQCKNPYYFHAPVSVFMSDVPFSEPFKPATILDIYCNTLEKSYPNGGKDVIVFDRDIIRRPGWEERKPPKKLLPESDGDSVAGLDDEFLYAIAEWDGKLVDVPPAVGDLARSKRRARNAVRDIARGNDLSWFVTFTLAPDAVDRYDASAVIRKLNTWLDNRVRRNGLAYVMVPEYHRDRAIHIHGLVNDALEMVDSGTVTATGMKHPVRPRSSKERQRMLSEGAVPVYNVPGWKLGFSTAIPLFGDREAAVGYVCKYVSKSDEKIGGRWYYHGGELQMPQKHYEQTSFDDALSYGDSFEVSGLGCHAVRYYIDPQGVIHTGGCKK